MANINRVRSARRAWRRRHSRIRHRSVVAKGAARLRQRRYRTRRRRRKSAERYIMDSLRRGMIKGITKRRPGRPYRKHRRARGVEGFRRSLARSLKKWKVNPMESTGAMSMIFPVVLGIAGFVGSTILVDKLPPSITGSFPILGVRVVVPMAAGLIAAFLVPKYVPQVANISKGLGLGFLIAGVHEIIHAVFPSLPRTTALFGYTPSENMGAVPTRAIATRPLDPAASPLQKPYGLGLPLEERKYNKYSWYGVYDHAAYE